MEKVKLVARSDLKKFAKLNGHSAMSYSAGSFLKYLSRKFGFSEYEIRVAHSRGKIRIEMP